MFSSLLSYRLYSLFSERVLSRSAPCRTFNWYDVHDTVWIAVRLLPVRASFCLWSQGTVGEMLVDFWMMSATVDRLHKLQGPLGSLHVWRTASRACLTHQTTDLRHWSRYIRVMWPRLGCSARLTTHADSLWSASLWTDLQRRTPALSHVNLSDVSRIHDLWPTGVLLQIPSLIAYPHTC